MKKQVVALVLSLLVLIVLGGFLLYALMLSGNTPQDNQQGNATVQDMGLLNLHHNSEEELNTITVENAAGGFKAINLGDSFGVEGCEGLPLSAQKCKELVEYSSNLCATLRLPASKEDNRYGLVPPVAAISVDLVGKEPVLFQVGSATEEGPSGYFVSYQEQVYVMDTQRVKLFLGDHLQFVEEMIVPPRGSQKVEKATLSGQVRPQPITVERKAPEQEGEPEEYFMTAPKNERVSSEAVLAWAQSPFGLHGEVVKVNPTPQDMVTFGFAEPFSALDLTASAGSFTLTATKPKQGQCYLMKSGVPIIYRVPEDALAWLTQQYQNIVGTLMEPVLIKDVAKLVVATPEASFTYRVAHGESGRNVTLNEQPFAQAAFETLLEQVSSVPPVEYIGETVVPLKPILTVRIWFTDEDRQQEQLAFVPAGEDTYYLVYNGVCTFTTNALPIVHVPLEDDASPDASGRLSFANLRTTDD